LTIAAAASRTLFCLHYLGGSGREFMPLSRLLAPEHQIAPIDLSGFGDACDDTGFAVADMVQSVATQIEKSGASQWWLVGHSMGAKVATVLTSQIEHGERTMAGLESVVLLAGSPPSPEPMDEDKRSTLLSWFDADRRTSRMQAQQYLDDNTTTPLTGVSREQAVDDLTRMNRAAWQAWLHHGSKEDWSERVGSLETTALLIAGERDECLGEAAQKKHTAPHFRHHQLNVVEGATHLLPLEAPEALARLLGAHARALRGA